MAILIEYFINTLLSLHRSLKFRELHDKVNKVKIIMPKKYTGSFKSVTCVSPTGAVMSLTFLSSRFLEFVHILEIPTVLSG